MLQIGIASFVVFSAMVGLAPNPPVLVAARVLQGLAGGLLNPQVAGLVQQMFPRWERGRAFGLIGTAVGVATATGPVIGGVILALGGPTLGRAREEGLGLYPQQLEQGDVGTGRGEGGPRVRMASVP